MPSETTKQKLQIIIEGVGKLVKLTSANKDLERSQRKLVKGIIDLNKKFDSRNALTRLEQQARKSKNAIIGLNTQIKRLASGMDRVRNSAVRATKSFRSFGLVRGVIFGSLISRGVAALTNAFTQSIAGAAEFLLKVGEIRTISQNAQQSTGEWASQLRKLSDQFGTPLLSVTEGAYQTLSNQIAEGAESTKFLAEAQRLSVITASTVDNAVLALTGTLNAYGLSADHAREVSDALFKTQELGRLRLDEIAGSLGTVNVLASRLGITYQEVFASLDVLTIQGVDAARGMTFLRGVMLKLIRPTTAMKELFKEWGVSSGQAAIDAFTFEGVLKKLQKRALASKDAMDEFGALFGRLRAILGISGLTLNGISDTLNEIKNSADSANEAFDIIINNVGKKFGIELQKIKNFFVVDIGTNLVKSIVATGEVFGSFSNLIITSLTIIGNIVKVLVVTFGVKLVLSFRLASINAAIFSLTVRDAAGNLLFLSTASNVAIAGVNKLGIRLKTAVGLLKAFAVAAIVIASFKITEAFLSMGDAIDVFNEKWTSKFKDESNKRLEVYNFEMRKLMEETTGAINIIVEGYTSLVDGLVEEFERLAALGGIQKSLGETIFKEEIANLLSRGKIIEASVKLQEKFNKLLAESGKLTGKLSVEEAKEAKARSQQLFSLAKQLRGLRGKFGGGTRGGVGGSILEMRGGQRRLTRGGRTRVTEGVSAGKAFQPFLESALKEARRIMKLIGQGQDLTILTTVRAQEDLNEKVRVFNLLTGESKQIQKEILEIMKAQNTEMSTVIDVFGKVRGAIAGIKKEITKGIGDNTRLGQLTGTLESFSFKERFEGTKKDNGVFTQEAAFLINLKKLGELLAGPTTPEKVFEMSVAIERLQQNFKRIQESGGRFGLPEEVGKQLEQISQAIALGSAALTRVNELQPAIDKLKETAVTLAAAKTELESLIKVFPEFQAAGGTALETIEAKMKQVVSTFVGLLSDLRTALAAAQNVLNRGATKKAQAELRATLKKQKGAQFGGRITRAHGGSIGKDSQSILLDPGEFVMNARQTAKFLPQLIAMNSGSRRFESGGTVTNVGDVNINVSIPEGQKINARQLGNDFRREISRGLLRN